MPDRLVDLPESLGGQVGRLGGARADADAAGLERLLLAGSRAGGARDDGAGMAHGLTGRRLEAGGVGDHGRANVLGDDRPCFLLLAAADFPTMTTRPVSSS